MAESSLYFPLETVEVNLKRPEIRANAPGLSQVLAFSSLHPLVLCLARLSKMGLSCCLSLPPKSIFSPSSLFILGLTQSASCQESRDEVTLG